MLDKLLILEKYQEGKTLRAIGSEFGVSKQRINQIVRPFYTGTNFRSKHGKPSPSKSELRVGKKLKELGFNFSFTRYMDLYDIDLNNGKRIEVKYASKLNKPNNYFMYPDINPSSFDFLIAIAGDLKKRSVYFIIPSEVCPKRLGLRIGSPKYSKYLGAWSLLS